MRLLRKRYLIGAFSIVSVEVRDLIIPKELQGVMSLEAQAECRKSARITLMEAERDVSEILDEVAQTYNLTKWRLRCASAFDVRGHAG